MNEFSRNCFVTVLLFFGLSQIITCTPERAGDERNAKKKYSLYVMMKDGTEYIVQTDTIDSGHIDPIAQGARVTPSRIFYELIVHNNSYYRLSWKNGQFVRNTIINKQYAQTDSIQLTGTWSVDNYNWLGDTLLIMGHDSQHSKARYAKITFDPMKAMEGVIDLPAPANGFNSMSIGFSTFLNGNLYLGYTYHKSDLNRYTTSDTLYVAELTYPGLKTIRTFTDTRSTYPGGVNTRQSHFFTDEKGDFYFISCPGIALGNNALKPTGIFRINKADGALDPDYFFNLSASPIHNHGYGFWYIGNNKAIVRTERKGLFKGMQDHYLVPHFDFYVLDLAKQTTVRLDLPLDKGTARNCILVEKGLVYIAVNPNSGGNYIWIYDPKAGSLRKGRHFDDQVDYILRLDRLNP
ncbi:DUF4374 domain-containing protein [Spirosoma endbachense]|uniref:DUF4374 domain-containing protein n=1 Tax=Spirosoma endbachense TaxID=2666025 RepID=A0A6P1VUT1_9BACT|nr:DUF4374 domain-containing protein [Spirosoma endbachense]QHV95136.1 DUF4374 domain-containing protein [Spirosoma endbachense]